jgi:flagellar hook-associated protein 2
MTLSSGSDSATFAIANGDSYATLAAAINARVPSLNVTASSVTDAHGTHLSIVSSDGTTPFSVDEPSFGFTQAIKGADANLTVDGVPITSASNTVTGAVSGVTLHLLGTTGTSATLTVASDAAGISTALNKFVSDFNTAIGLVNSQFNYSATSSSQGVLGSDPVVRSLQQALQGTLSYLNTPASGTTAMSTLASMGINVADDGTLSIDSVTLNNALVSSPSDVQNFFQGTALNGFAASFSAALDNFTSPSHGAFTVDLKSINQTVSDLTDQISNYESGYIAAQQTLLTAMYSKAEIALQSLPSQMAQLNAQLGFNTKSGS